VRPRIRPALWLSFAAALLVASPPGAAAGGPCAGALASLQTTYRSLSTLTARFRHTLHAKTLGQEEVETGTLYLAAKGRMRWQYETPKGKLAVSDGSHSWLYLPAEKQVFVQEVGAGPDAPLAIRLLTGSADLSREFSCIEARQTEGVTTLRLKPVEEVPGVQEVEVTVGPGGLLQRVSYTDGLGNEILLEFTELKSGGVLDASLFQFQPPKDAKVLQAGGG